MKIGELVNSGEFSFNVEYRIYEYTSHGYTDLKYDSRNASVVCPVDLQRRDITAINQASDGAVEIEYAEEFGW